MSVVSGPTGGGAHYDRLAFLGPRVPNEVKLLRNLSTIDEQTFRALLKLAVTDVEGGQIRQDEFQAIVVNSSPVMNPDDVSNIYGGLLSLLKAAVRQPESSLKPEVFREDLKELGIPQNFIADLVNVVYGARRLLINERAVASSPHLDRLQDLRWRVDVAISTSSLSRVLEPSVLMEVTTSSGQVHTFEVFPQQFHQLRFAVACLLKEMGELEKKSIMKQ